MTTTTVDTDRAVRELRADLAHAEKRAAETEGERIWLYWSAQVDAYRRALTVLDARP